MKTWKLNANDTKTLDTLLEFLVQYSDAKLVRVDEYGFSRTIGFTILGRYYEIIWYLNLCTIYVGGVDGRPLQSKFDAISTNVCYPVLHGGNDNLVFSRNGVEMVNLPLPVGTL